MRIGNRWQWETTIRGWWLCACVGQIVGIGILWHGPYNGISVTLGPLTLDLAPPAPITPDPSTYKF